MTLTKVLTVQVYFDNQDQLDKWVTWMVNLVLYHAFTKFSSFKSFGLLNRICLIKLDIILSGMEVVII